MGADSSLPLPLAKPDFPMMSVTFCKDDRITVLHLDSARLSVIGQVIRETWKSGIQSEQSCCGTGWSFKLSGQPFWLGNNQEVREMVMKILQRLHGIGYQVLASGTLGTKEDKSTLFFKKAPSNIVAPQFLCISFHSSDKIQFSNLPTQLIDPIKDTIRRSWNMGIQNVLVQNGILEFKLGGRPWKSTDSKQSIMARVLLQNIFKTLHGYQWVYHINVNVNGNPDCLIFRHDEEVNTSEDTKFFSVCLSGDRLRLICASEEIVAMVRNTIEANWNPGCIQHEKNFHNSLEFKISGNPWNSVKEESARARYLMLKIFQKMLQHGWHNVAAFYHNRTDYERVTLLFQKREPLDSPMFCIAPFDDNKIWLINMPNNLVLVFKTILQARWVRGITSEKEIAMHFGTVHKLILSGTPWSGGESSSPIHARSFLCNIIEEFSQYGWKLMLSADVTSRIVGESDGPDWPMDVYSFWFIYDPTNVRTEPSAPFDDYPPSYSQQYSSPHTPQPPFQGSTQPPNEPPLSYGEATGWQ